jgi:hypothetical protein
MEFADRAVHGRPFVLESNVPADAKIEKIERPRISGAV